MKKFIPLLLFSAAIISLCLTESCKESSSLTACINTLPATVSQGYPLTFSSCTSGASSYTWDFGFGAGAPSTSPTITYSYGIAGTYNGSLTVTSGSSSSTKNFTITVYPNNFTFKGTTYLTDSVITTGGIGLAAMNTVGNSMPTLDYIFQSLPTTSGNYTVVNAANANPGPGQVFVVLYNHGGPTYGSTGSGTSTAAVTVSGGKLTISLPSAEMVNLNNASDSASIGTITQQTQ